MYFQHRRNSLRRPLSLMQYQIYASHTAKEVAVALFRLFSARSTRPTRVKKLPTPSFACLVLDLRFQHSSKSRGRRLPLVYCQVYASHTAEPADAFFRMFGDETMLITQREKPPTPSFTCLETKLSFTNGRETVNSFRDRALIPTRRKSHQSRLSLDQSQFYTSRNRGSRRRPHSLVKCKIYASHTAEEATAATLLHLCIGFIYALKYSQADYNSYLC